MVKIKKKQEQELLDIAQKFLTVYGLNLEIRVLFVDKKWILHDNEKAYGMTCECMFPTEGGGFSSYYSLQLACIHSIETIKKTLAHELAHICILEDLEYTCDNYARLIMKECS